MENMFVCFNYKQVAFINKLMDLKLIKPTGAGRVRHPITGKTEIIFQKYTSSKMVSSIAQVIFDWLMDNEGRLRFQRMIDCGAIRPATKCEEESESAGDLYLRF